MTKMASVATPVPTSKPAATAALETQLRRIEGEYREMPGLSVTSAQAARLWGVTKPTCALALMTLVEAGILKRTSHGTYILHR